MFDLLIAWLLSGFALFGDPLVPPPHEAPAAVEAVGNDTSPTSSLPAPGPSRSDKATGDTQPPPG